MAQKFPRVYNANDFAFTANVTAQPSQWNRLFSVTVPAQQMVTWGNGDTSTGVDTRGQAYIKISTTASGTSVIAGKIRLALSDANETRQQIVAEQRTEMFSADQTDRTKSLMLGEYPVKAKQDSKLIVYYYPDGAVAETLVYNGTSTAITLPVTVYQ